MKEKNICRINLGLMEVVFLEDCLENESSGDSYKSR